MNCGGYRNSCAPRLMPYGKGYPSSYCSDPKYNCMGPCDGKKAFNVHVQEPIYTYSPGSQGDECDKKGPVCEPNPLPPINVNIKMCPKGSQFGAGGDCQQETQGPNQPLYQMSTETPSTTVAPCCAGGECVACDYTPRKPRCVDMNYVERTESLKPEVLHVGIPYKLDDRTTYRDFFHLKPRQEPPLPCRPVSKLFQSTGKTQQFSEYKYAYVPFPTIPYKKPEWSKKEEFKGVEGELSGVTTYKSDYQRLVGKPAQSSKPRFFIDPTRGPLEDRTTYKVDFPAHSKCRERAMSTKPDPILFVATVGAPFDGQTMYKTDFMSPCMTTARSFKPTRRGKEPDGKFEDATTYRKAYLPFTYMKCSPIENKPCFPFEERDMQAREYGSSVW